MQHCNCLFRYLQGRALITFPDGPLAKPVFMMLDEVQSIRQGRGGYNGSGHSPKASCSHKVPVLLFLGFLDCLGRFEARNFLGYFGVFSVFSKDFVGSFGNDRKSLVILRFSLIKTKKPRKKKDRGLARSRKIRLYPLRLYPPKTH